ncbi:MAG: Na/Pi cotransporter family protein [Gammaproteobacteria bacterium]|nr:Na/Pi cotransporter family protein [Gammaproteobacteria bacterium]
MLALGMLIYFAPATAAVGAGENGPEWVVMATNLLGGLALFLFGMEQMSDALKSVAGERMKTILSRLTTNRFMGAITGAFVTAVIQSSSVTTVLVVGFISAGLMSTAQSIGVIMGANIGTTITAQIIAFKVTKFAMLMIAIGFGMLFISKREKVRDYGAMIMGLGLVFFGMHVMSEAMQPLRSYQPFLDLMIQMENPLLGILISALFTALVQSSSATTGIVIVMASQGFISLPAGIALAFGANIGTCVTAVIAALGKPREAVRAAVVHVLFNVFGVLLWVGFIDQLAVLVTAMSPIHPELQGVDRLAHEAPRQIANAHTVFNIANTVIFIGFTGVFARLVERLVPDKPIDLSTAIRPRYLEESIVDTPVLALDRVRLESLRVGAIINGMLTDIGPAFVSGDRHQLHAVARKDDDVDVLHGHIIRYLGMISRGALSDAESHELSALMAIANDMEGIGDLIETDLVSMGLESARKHLLMSEISKGVLEDMHAAVVDAVRAAVQAVDELDFDMASEVIANKREIKHLADIASTNMAERLRADAPHRLEMYTMEISVIEKLWRIYYYAKRIARNVQILARPEAGMAEFETSS